MNSKNYVLHHNYGYGLDEEENELNKLTLRNLTDLKVYITDLTKQFNAKRKHNKLKFNNETIKIKIKKV